MNLWNGQVDSRMARVEGELHSQFSFMCFCRIPPPLLRALFFEHVCVSLCFYRAEHIFRFCFAYFEACGFRGLPGLSSFYRAFKQAALQLPKKHFHSQ